MPGKRNHILNCSTLKDLFITRLESEIADNEKTLREIPCQPTYHEFFGFLLNPLDGVDVKSPWKISCSVDSINREFQEKIREIIHGESLDGVFSVGDGQLIPNMSRMSLLSILEKKKIDTRKHDEIIRLWEKYNLHLINKKMLFDQGYLQKEINETESEIERLKQSRERGKKDSILYLEKRLQQMEKKLNNNVLLKSLEGKGGSLAAYERYKKHVMLDRSFIGLRYKILSKISDRALLGGFEKYYESSSDDGEIIEQEKGIISAVVSDVKSKFQESSLDVSEKNTKNISEIDCKLEPKQRNYELTSSDRDEKDDFVMAFVTNKLQYCFWFVNDFLDFQSSNGDMQESPSALTTAKIELFKMVFNYMRMDFKQDVNEILRHTNSPFSIVAADYSNHVNKIIVDSLLRLALKEQKYSSLIDMLPGDLQQKIEKQFPLPKKITQAVKQNLKVKAFFMSNSFFMLPLINYLIIPSFFCDDYIQDRETIFYVTLCGALMMVHHIGVCEKQCGADIAPHLDLHSVSTYFPVYLVVSFFYNLRLSELSDFPENKVVSMIDLLILSMMDLLNGKLASNANDLTKSANNLLIKSRRLRCRRGQFPVVASNVDIETVQENVKSEAVDVQNPFDLQ